MIILDGKTLTITDIDQVARHNEKVTFKQSAIVAINAAREYVDQKLESGEVIYGLNTGFGKFSDKMITPDEVAHLQRNLIVSHSCGMGRPLPTEVVRAIMLLRLNALCGGRSGIRLSTMQTLLDMLNKGVHPVIPEQGSLGASGDLAPLAHMVLPMIGEGMAEYRGETLSGSEAMRRADIPITKLAAKEGLALINGTQVMTAIGALVSFDAKNIVKTADIVAAMTAETQNAILKAFDPKIQAVRGHEGQIKCAQNMLKLLEGSQLSKDRVENKVQDAYSIRCIPQIHGASRDAIEYVYEVVSREINAATDNPLVFPDEDEVISGGNFHGQPMALAFDFLGIALSELANVSERRTERMVNPSLNFGLPAFLAKNGGLNSGFMIAKYAAASIVSENKVLAHPASVDSIPSSANQEDHVSMGTTAARKARTILENVQKVLGVELYVAGQAIWLRGEDKISPVLKFVYQTLRSRVPAVEMDVVMYENLNQCEQMVRAGALITAAEAACGPLN